MTTAWPAVRVEKQAQRVAAAIEDVEWLLSWGEHPSRIAPRLHMTMHGLEMLLRRAGRADLAAVFHQEVDRSRRHG